MLYFAKDRKKSIAIVNAPGFRPSGACGAIAAGSVLMVSSDLAPTPDQLKVIVDGVASVPKAPPADFASPNKVGSTVTQVAVSGSGACVLHGAQGSSVASLAASQLKDSTTILFDDASRQDELAKCKLCVVVMTSDFQSGGLKAFEEARNSGTEILPVVGQSGFRPSGWLALGISGLLYYDLTVPDEVHYDSTNLKDFSLAANIQLANVTAAAELTADEKEIQEVTAEIADIKPKLEKAEKWPPPLGWKKQKREVLGEGLQYNYIPYSRTLALYAYFLTACSH